MVVPSDRSIRRWTNPEIAQLATGGRLLPAPPKSVGGVTGWAAGPLLAFDTETTGLDVDKERIVSAYLGDGGRVRGAGCSILAFRSPRGIRHTRHHIRGGT